MRGLYAHASPRMRENLTAALQAWWEQSLRDRAAMDPRSSVPLIDDLLAAFRNVTLTRNSSHAAEETCRQAGGQQHARSTPVCAAGFRPGSPAAHAVA
jgi:hypothetical protein